MSGEKIKSKDLSYDSTLPPFLQRLRAQNSGNGDSDRHEREIARPKGKKDPNDDDGPTVVDEAGETLSKEDVEKQLSKEERSERSVGGNVTGKLENAGEVVANSGALPDDAETKKGDNVTDGVATKKRKVGKVVGGDEEDDASKAKSGSMSSGNEKVGADHKKGREEKGGEKASTKVKKKAKQIKLAFNNDDEEG